MIPSLYVVCITVCNVGTGSIGILHVLYLYKYALLVHNLVFLLLLSFINCFMNTKFVLIKMKELVPACLFTSKKVHDTKKQICTCTSDMTELYVRHNK